MKIKDGIFCVFLLLCILGGMTACDPISPEDRAFFKEQDRLRGEKIANMKSANVGVSIDEVINRVKRYPAHEGEQTMEEWVFANVFRKGGQILFPQWNARRQGSNIQEVTFEFTLLSNEGQMKRYTYSWEVDVLDMTVRDPSVTELEQIESPEEILKNQQLRRVKQHEQELL